MKLLDVAIDDSHLSRVKAPVLLPLAIALSVILAAFFAVVWVWTANQQQRELVDSVQQFDDQLYQSSEELGKYLIQNQRWIETTLSFEAVKEDSLSQVLFQDAFQRSRESLQVNRLALLSPSKDVLMSVSELDDTPTVSDSVTQRAIETNGASVGLLLLEDGELVIRAVSPVTSGNEVYGYLLTDKPFENLVTSMASALDMYVSVLVDKDRVNQSRLEARYAQFGRSLDSSLFEQHLSLANNDRLLDQAIFRDTLHNYLASDLNKEVYYRPGLVAGERSYDVGIVPILNVNGETAARLIVAKETTQEREEFYFALTVNGVVASVVAILLFTFFYFLLGRIEQQIQSGEALLVKAKDDSEKHRQEAESLREEAERTRDAAEEAREAAVQASKVKSEFLAKMSHELRTPLNAIIGLSEMMHEDAKEFEDEDYIEPLERVLRAAKHLLSLINDILDISKIEAGKMELHKETFNLDLLLKDVLATIQPLTDKKGIELKGYLPPQGDVFNDQTRLRQILLNLLSNATKFTDQGNVELSVFNDGHQLHFEVKDSGIGMTEEQCQTLFQDFVQVDSANNRKHEGTGLGLAISRKFARMMGGDIQVSSEQGKGSVFKVTIPYEEPSVQSGELSEETISRIVKVMIVDDDQTGRQLVARYLDNKGYQIHFAEDGAEALKLAREIKPNLITLDIEMPGLNGWDTMAALKADPELVAIPVIVISTDDNKAKGFALGADDYLIKPLDQKTVDEMLMRLQKKVRQGQKSVLIIDDSEDARLLVKNSLSKMGWTIREAGNGFEGVEQLKQEVPDLIMLDLMMPEMDGFEFLSQIEEEEKWKAIPIVVMTAMSLNSLEKEALESQVATIMEKGNFNREKLQQCVAKLLR